MVNFVPSPDGIGRVKGFVNAYTILQPDGIWLLDTSFSKKAKPILRVFREAGQDPAKITKILLTHQHTDHMGGAAKLHDISRAQVLCQSDDAPYVEGKQKAKMGFLMRLFMSPRPVPVGTYLKDGDTIGPLRVIHVPGHTVGNVAFYDIQKRVLYAGDTLREDKGRLTLPAPRFAFNLEMAVASLKKLQGLDVRVMLPGHGEPVKDDFPSLLDDLIKRAPRDFLGQ